MDFDLLEMPSGCAGCARAEADALLIVITPAGAARRLDRPVAAALQAALDAKDLEPKAGKAVLLLRPPRVAAPRLVFAVAGDATPKAFHKAVQAGLALLKLPEVRHVVLAFAPGEAPADAPAGAPAGASADGQTVLSDAHAEVAAMAAAEAAYLYRHTKPSAPPPPALARLTLACDPAEQAALRLGLERGAAVAEGMTLARECANRPANHCTPTFLADEARRVGKAAGIKVEVLERDDAHKLGMGAFLAVAQGSAQPPKFIVMRWQGAGRKDAPVVLVGKGVTFDTGGISLKPAAEMDEMKFDMGGAASVLGTMLALARLKARINVVGLIVATENMPSGTAVKPGDVVTTMSGQTVEILNTDAEGRLILCDALTYAQRLKPSAVVDIATLTGACVIALGHHRSGLFSPDEALASALQQAGDAALDPCWRMPLDEEYDDALKSHFADIANVGPRAGGSITAAMFLKRFTAQMRWAHLDIAGTAWKSGAAKGATGRPVPLLTHFVLGQVQGAA